MEIICPEEKVSHNERLTFHQSLATEELLTAFFAKKHYEGMLEGFASYVRDEKQNPYSPDYELTRYKTLQKACSIKNAQSHRSSRATG